MIKSMTGFGTQSGNYNDIFYTIDIKSINSKIFDINFISPRYLIENEIFWKKIILEKLKRGKITVSISIDKPKYSNILSAGIDPIIFKKNYLFIKSLYQGTNFAELESTFFENALKHSYIKIDNNTNPFSKKEIEYITNKLEETVMICDNSRKKEGNEIEKEIKKNISFLEKGLKKIIEISPTRVNKLKNNINEKIKYLKTKIDQNKFEEEIFYYIEKLDINEEIVRLKTHINYLKKTLTENNSGKKLQFISQEINREINTIGSKANDENIQTIVINMKQQLEQIKEQLFNVL